MRLFTAEWNKRCFLLFFGVLVAFVFWMRPPGASAANEKEEGKKDAPEYKVFGRDPKAYEDAAAMLSIPGQRRLEDEAAGTILAALETAIAKGEPWSPAIWMQLDNLRSARLSPLQVQSLQHAAQKMGVTDKDPLPEKASAAKQAFEEGNRHYEAGRFDQAIASYRSAVSHHPAYWDACNNLALSEMHRNNDLAAAFILSSLTRNNPKYAGAAINLSVCLERLGQGAAAYAIAATLALKQDRMPMAQYNMAWFENSRGNYASSSDHLLNALSPVPDYPVALWLQSINTMESGRNITADELKALPQRDQLQGVPGIVDRPVKAAVADAYSGKDVVARIPKGSRLVISRETGGWCGFFWPVEGVKRFLWVRKTNLGSTRMELAAEGIQPFLGRWTGKWGKFTEPEIRIQDADGKPRVTMQEDKVRDEKLENGSLSFWAKKKDFGGDWFRYSLRVTPDGLEMDVYMTKNNQKFTGKLTEQ